MGVMVRYVEADKRTGRLSYRRIYPAELRPFVPGQVRELKRSLRSTNIHSPEASRLYAEAQAEYERYVASARRVSAGTTRPLTAADTPFLVASYVHSLRRNLHDTHWDDTDASREWLTASAWRYAPLGFMDAIGADMAGRPDPWNNSERLREALPGLIAEWRTIRANGVRAALIDAEGQTAEDLCREHGITVDQQSAEFVTLCRHLLDADLITAQSLARSVDPEDAPPLEVPAAPEPLPAPVEAISAPPRTNAGSVPLLDLFDGYATAQGIAPRGKKEWRNAIRHFITFLGHDDAARVTREDVNGWRDALLASPTRYGKVRPVRLELVARQDGDFELTWPDERVWKRAAARLR